MSLVDYASSDEDEADVREEEKEERRSFQAPKDESKENQPPPPSQLSSNEVFYPESSHSSEPSVVKLPDASLLLNSTHVPSHMLSSGDHSSRVAAAMAERESRKRVANISVSALSRSKVPKGNLPHPRRVPDTVGSLLVPPQLSGRSNIVTEDISKLFVRRNADPSSQ